MTDALKELARSQQQLAMQALAAYKPLVESIIENKSTDQEEIKHVLDGLLGFCFDDALLLLYRKLCRYYYGLDPSATADYVNLYREMWDEDGKMNFKKDKI